MGSFDRVFPVGATLDGGFFAEDCSVPKSRAVPIIQAVSILLFAVVDLPFDPPVSPLEEDA